MLDAFGIPYHQAPGEAEAECAVLQKNGIVDCVLSEDVDTLMFGATFVLRDWSPERGKGAATHVNVHTNASILDQSGLDQQGMILVALLSGGDYNTYGVQGCGFKTACEAARAGFGAELCKLDQEDTDSLADWRARLQHELQTNEQRFFRQKHKSIIIPSNFPDLTVLGYYRHPKVSSEQHLPSLKPKIAWRPLMDVRKLRNFVAEFFGWTHCQGAKRFIRMVAPTLLVQRLLYRHSSSNQEVKALDEIEAEEIRLLKNVSARRNHWEMAGHPTLRVAYIPAEIVGLDMTLEYEPANDPLSASEDDEMQPPIFLEDIDEIDVAQTLQASLPSVDSEQAEKPLSQVGRTPKSQALRFFDPNKPERVWILESIVKLGAPLLAENWEIIRQSPRKNRRDPKANPQGGAIEQYLRCMKPNAFLESTSSQETRSTTGKQPVYQTPNACDTADIQLLGSSKTRQENGSPRKAKRPFSKASTFSAPMGKISSLSDTQGQTTRPPRSRPPLGKASSFSSSGTKASTRDSPKDTNPWSLAKLAKRPLDTYGFVPRTRYSALGILSKDDLEIQDDSRAHQESSLAESPFISNGQHTQPCWQLDINRGTLAEPIEIDGMFQGNLDNVTVRSPRKHKTRSPLGTSTEEKVAMRINCPEPQNLSVSLTGSSSSREPIGSKDLIILRESLEGTWKYGEPDQAGPASQIYRGVQEFDLTGE